jgi:hypothetical protein
LRDPWLDEDIEPLKLTENEIDDVVAFMVSLTSSEYKEIGEKELGRQRALSRISRPQRDTARAFAPKQPQPKPPCPCPWREYCSQIPSPQALALPSHAEKESRALRLPLWVNERIARAIGVLGVGLSPQDSLEDEWSWDLTAKIETKRRHDQQSNHRLLQAQDDLRADAVMQWVTSTPAITEWQNCLDEKLKTVLRWIAVEIFSRKKLIQATPLKTDRPVDCAEVVRCAICATPNYLKSHMPKKSNPLFSNIHAETRKLWGHSSVTGAEDFLICKLRGPLKFP